MKTYLLKPVGLTTTVTATPDLRKPRDPAGDALVAAIMPPTPVVAPASLPTPAVVLPSRQPLPTRVVEAAKPILKLGLDVHLDFLMAVAQRTWTRAKPRSREEGPLRKNFNSPSPPSRLRAFACDSP